MVSSTRRTAGCGPACPVVWQGRVGDYSPYADSARCLFQIETLVSPRNGFHQSRVTSHESLSAIGTKLTRPALLHGRQHATAGCAQQQPHP